MHIYSALKHAMYIGSGPSQQKGKSPTLSRRTMYLGTSSYNLSSAGAFLS